MPETYERCLVPALFVPHAIDLARRAATHGPGRVLELAAGTGVLTRHLVGALPAATLTATDLNQAMVDFGSARISGAVWQQADATDLPFEDASYDLVMCQFGVMFFPDKQRAFREVARVMKPGGRFLLNTWDVIERNDFAAALDLGVVKAFPDDPPTFIVRVPHGYTDPMRVAADLRGGGLHLEEQVTVALTGRAGSATQIAIGFCYGTPLRMAIEERGDVNQACQTISAEMTALLGDGPVEGVLTAHVVTATR
jgi:SAM-dependent methyltransferase